MNHMRKKTTVCLATDIDDSHGIFSILLYLVLVWECDRSARVTTVVCLFLAFMDKQINLGVSDKDKERVFLIL